MKKILLVNNGYPSLTHPNYVTYIQSIEECLKEAGFYVDLLVLDSNFDSTVGKYFRFFRYYLKALFFGSYVNYDYIYINNYPYSFLPMIPHFHRMKRVIIHWHGDDIFPGTFFSSLLNRVSYWFIRSNFIHIAPSIYFAGEVSRVLGISYDSVFVSPSGGVDTSQFNIGERSHKKSGVLRLGFASGLLRSKGMDLVMKLLENVEKIELHAKRRIEFHFINYGSEKDFFIERLSKMKFSVKHEPYAIKDMVKFYNNIDVLLFPSLREAESLGLVTIEAMSCGVPVIASDAFALKDTVIGGVTGERFAMNNSESFEQALIKCIDSIEQYNPREFVIKSFSKASVVQGYKSLLNQ